MRETGYLYSSFYLLLDRCYLQGVLDYKSGWYLLNAVTASGKILGS